MCPACPLGSAISEHDTVSCRKRLIFVHKRISKSGKAEFLCQNTHSYGQEHYHGENLFVTCNGGQYLPRLVGIVSENLCASAVVPVSPVGTSLGYAVGSVNDGLCIRDPAGNLRELPAEVEVPCVSRRVVIGVFFIPEIRISLLTIF